MLCILSGHLNPIFLSCDKSLNGVEQGNVGLETQWRRVSKGPRLDSGKIMRPPATVRVRLMKA